MHLLTTQINGFGEITNLQVRIIFFSTNLFYKNVLFLYLIVVVDTLRNKSFIVCIVFYSIYSINCKEIKPVDQFFFHNEN